MSSLPSIIRFPRYQRIEAATLNQSEADAVESALLKNPEAGDVIPSTGGMRKLRVAAKGKGKRGGARTIYFLRIEHGRIYLCDMLDKSDTENLTPSDKASLKQLADQIRAIPP